VAIDHFETRRQQPVGIAHVFIVLAHGLVSARAGESSASTAKGVLRARVTQILQQARDLWISERHALHVHDRISKPGTHQGIADVVHIQKTMHVFELVCPLPAVTKFNQGVGTEGREHDRAFRRQHPAQRFQRRYQFDAPVQFQIGKHQVEGALAKGECR